MTSKAPIFLLVLVILVLFVIGGIFFYRFISQKRRNSRDPFSNRQHPSDQQQSGPVGWIKSKVTSLGGSKSGAYEQPRGSARHQRGLDPDSAWDTRVGAEADGYGEVAYEEQELGPYRHSEERHVLPEYGVEDAPRGRSRSRDPAYVGGGQEGLDRRYDEEMGRGGDPFGDHTAERSELRNTSPRPHEDRKKGLDGQDDSLTERRSMFHENV